MTGGEIANHCATVVAGTCPFWAPLLKDMSETAAVIAPIFAVILLVVQIVLIVLRIRAFRRRGRNT
jgi:hypothetical protein